MILNFKNINRKGELIDRELEKEFFRQEMQKAMCFLKPILFSLGILDSLFIIPDYFFIKDKNAFIMAAAGRMLFIVLLTLFSAKLNHFRDYRSLSRWITVYEIISVLLFLFVMYQYETPNYFIQAFGVIEIVLAFFIVPNRWINMIFVSFFVAISFLAMSAYYIEDIEFSEFLSGAVYIFVTILLSSIMSFRNQYNKRIQYVNGKELLRLSTIDHLSGTYNRDKLNFELNYWVELSKDNNHPLSLAILDIDNFKRINDTHGHLEGDNVISEIASIIHSSIRKTDILARWGGDEFALLFPETDILSAAETIERIQTNIKNHAFSKAQKVTCSFGIAQLSNDDSIKDFLHKADQMLYAAKNAGKNTFKMYNTTEAYPAPDKSV